MAGLERITNPLLDVLEVLLNAAAENDHPLHGWAIMRAVSRSGPTVYGVLDRLEDAGLITGEWEKANPQHGKPPRRLYRLTGEGITSARELLAERRPLRPPGVRHGGAVEALGWLRRLQVGWGR
jgi:DNA-binding PadR family transcriptional regulator